MRSVSLVCALTLLTALGCSGEGDDTLKTACDDYTDCPPGVGCFDGYCQGEASGTGGGEDTVSATGSSNIDGADISVTSEGGHCADDATMCEVTEGATVTFRAGDVKGYRFDGWTGEDPRCLSAKHVLIIENVNSDIACQAIYVQRFMVTGLAADGGAAPAAMSSAEYADCSGASCEVDEGSAVTLTAAPRDQQRLGEFSGEGCDQLEGDTVTVTATGDVTCTAVYVAGARVTGEVAGAQASVAATSSSSGASCSDNSCAVDLGGQVTLTAPSVDGHRFAGWSGEAEACAGAEPVLVISNVQASFTCTATYVSRHVVRGEAQGASPAPAVEATSLDSFASCEGAACEVDEGGEVRLSAPAVSSYRVASWSGDGCDHVSGDSVVVAGVLRDVTCTAHYVLGTSVSGAVVGATGTVTATSSSPGAQCGNGKCSIDVGGSVTLTAPPLADTRFLGWGGGAGCTGTGLTITLSNVQSSISCEARYVARLVVTGTPRPTAGGSVSASSPSANASCSGASCTVDRGSTVSLDVTASGGYRFAGWGGDSRCSGTGDPLTLGGVNDDIRCDAEFKQRFTARGTVSGAPNGTAVSATSSASPPVASCSGNACTVDEGSDVTLAAPSVNGYRFTGWSGTGCTDSDTDGNVRTLRLASVTAERTCVAGYIQQFTVEVATSPSNLGGVTVRPSGGSVCANDRCLVDAGSSVTIQATESSAARFSAWSGNSGCAGANATRTFTVSASTTCTAGFYGLWSRTFTARGRPAELTYDLIPRRDGDVVIGAQLAAGGSDTRAVIGLLDRNTGALGSSHALRRSDFPALAAGLTGDQSGGYGMITSYIASGVPKPVILRFDGNRNLLGSTTYFSASEADVVTRITARAGTGYAAAGYIDQPAGTPDRAHVIAASTSGAFLFDRALCMPLNCADQVCFSTRAVDIVATSTGFAVLSLVEVPIPSATFAGSYGAIMLSELDTAGATTRERFYARTVTDPATGGQQPLSLEPASLLRTSDGGYVVVGATRERVGATTYDGFAMKLNPADLRISWQTRLGSAGTDERFARVTLALDGASFAIAGSAAGNQSDGWLVQLSASGSPAGVDVLYDLGFADALLSLASVPTGGYVLGGHSTPAEGAAPDAWALRVDEAGEITFNAGSGAALATGNHTAIALGVQDPGTPGCAINQSTGREQPAITDLAEPAFTIDQTLQAP